MNKSRNVRGEVFPRLATSGTLRSTGEELPWRLVVPRDYGNVFAEEYRKEGKRALADTYMCDKSFEIFGDYVQDYILIKPSQRAYYRDSKSRPFQNNERWVDSSTILVVEDMNPKSSYPPWISNATLVFGAGVAGMLFRNLK